jgi:hypothetical protein
MIERYMTYPDVTYKILGPLSISVTWLGLLFLIRHWKGNKSMSFSLHAAQTRTAQIYYFFLFGITLPLFYLFVTRWFVPALRLPRLYIYIVSVALLGQLIAILIPAIEGRKEKIHNLGAYLMAFCLIPLTVLLVFSNLPLIIKILAIIGALYMTSTIALSFVTKAIQQKFLPFQAAFVGVFHCLILISMYSIHSGS